MAKPLLARLSKLEQHFDVRGTADGAEVRHLQMQLIMSDPVAYELASQYADTVELACQRQPELRALRSDYAAFLHRVNIETLRKMHDEAQLLEDRVEWLRQQREKAQANGTS